MIVAHCLKQFTIVACFLFVSLWGTSSQSMAQTNVNSIKDKAITQEKLLPESSSLVVRASLTSALEVGRINDLKFYDAPGMKAFYESRGYEPVWIKNSLFGKQKTNSILKALENSWTHGLNPNQYHVVEIRQLMDEVKGKDRFQLDLVLSDALVRYGRDMSAMRVNPKAIGQRSRYWRKPLRAIDVLDHVSSQTDVTAAMKSLEPKGQLYKRLQEELNTLYQTTTPQEKESMVHINGIVRPGAHKKSVLSIRNRMGFNADNAPQGAYYYDDQLASAVMAFQKSHGLKPDGIVGRQTVKLMNITREDKINQVLANLERLRWVEQNKPNRYIMVNVPSATLWAVEDEEVKLEMPVVVGRPKRPTNIFSTQVTGIRYNPTWTVPPTIKRDDYLPKLRKDPYYLSDRGIELMEGGQTIDPGQIDWKSKTWGEVNAMRMVQGSGRTNPLGRVRFLMNNPFNIYLHDTTTKSYFKRADRALSSGCIRLEKPIELADFVLNPNDNWSPERRDEILNRGKLKEVYAQKPLPVYILYQTVWLGEHNQIVYGADIYGHDTTLIKALSEIDGVAIPVAADEATKTAQVN